MKKIFYTVALAALLVCCASSALAAAKTAGLVLTVQAGAWVERDGQKSTLNVKSPIMSGDVLVTDSSGRLQVIFADDTTISLGADTRVAVADFLFDVPGKKSSFSADMAQGAARFVTGKVVEQNRKGFSVTTPQATVGIRGTTFAVNVSPKGVTSVIGLKVDGAYPIAVTNRKTGAVSTISASGMAVDAAPGGNTGYKAPPGQFSQTGSAVSGQANVAAAAPAASSGSGASGPAPVTAAVSAVAAEAATGEMAPAASGADSTAPLASASSASSAAPGSTGSGSLYSGDSGAVRELANSAGKEPDSILTGLGPLPSTPGIPGPGPGPTLTATYSGTLYKSAAGPWSPGGNFSFDANLAAGSGTISNAILNVTDWGSLSATQKGAPGTVTDGVLNVGLTVDSPGTASSWISTGNGAYMYGGGSNLGGINGTGVSGKWSIITDGGQPMYSQDTYFEGSKQP